MGTPLRPRIRVPKSPFGTLDNLRPPRAYSGKAFESPSWEMQQEGRAGDHVDRASLSSGVCRVLSGRPPPQHTKTETLSHTPRCHTWSPKPVPLNKCLCVLIGLLESCAPLSPITEAVARCTAIGQTRPRDQRGRCWTATSPRSTAARKALAGSWLGFRLLCILEGVGRDSPVGPLAPGSPATQCGQRREAGNPLRRPTLTCPSRFDLMANFKLSKVGAVGQRPPPASAVCSAGHVSVLGAFPVCNRGVRTCGSADRFGERTRGAHGSAAGRHVTTPSY